MIKALALSSILFLCSVSCGPSPEPRPKPQIIMYPHSKIGIHAIKPNGTAPFAQAAVNGKTHFSVVKAVNDVGYLAEVKTISPNTITIARFTHPDEGAWWVNDPDTNLWWYATVIMQPILARLPMNSVDYWEPVNEPLGGGVSSDVYARLAQLMIHCMDIAEANGIKLALFSFNLGTPEWQDIQYVVETGVFARAKSGGHVLALHEGVLGDDPIDTCYGATIPGAPDVDGAGCLTRRYRFWYHVLEDRDEIVPLVITEFYGGYNVNDIVDRMAWYDQKTLEDDYVIGFTPFTLGPTSQWKKQDYEWAYPALIAYMVELHRKYLESLSIKIYIPIIIK